MDGVHEEYFNIKRTWLNLTSFEHISNNIKEEIQRILDKSNPLLLVSPITMADGEKFRSSLEVTQDHPALLPLMTRIQESYQLFSMPMVQGHVQHLLMKLICFLEHYGETLCSLDTEQRSLFLSKIILVEGPVGSFLVSPQKVLEVLMIDQYGFSLAREHPGLHPTKKLGNIFFKKDHGLTSLRPGVEIAASLLHTIIFDDFAVNPVSLFKISNVETKNFNEERKRNTFLTELLHGKAAEVFFADNPSWSQTFEVIKTDYLVQASLFVPERGFHEITRDFM